MEGTRRALSCVYWKGMGIVIFFLFSAYFLQWLQICGNPIQPRCREQYNNGEGPIIQAFFYFIFYFILFSLPHLLSYLFIFIYLEQNNDHLP